VCESGRECETTPSVFSSFTSLFDSFKHAFRHDWITTFVRTFYYNVTAISSPRCIRSSRQRISQTRRPSALSCGEELHETLTRNTKEKQNQNENATHYTRRLIYCLARVRQRKGRFPGQNAPILSPKKAMAVTSVTSLTSAETNRTRPAKQLTAALKWTQNRRDQL